MERQSFETVTLKGFPLRERDKSPILTLTTQMWKLKSRVREFLLKIAQLTSGQEGLRARV